MLCFVMSPKEKSNNPNLMCLPELIILLGSIGNHLEVCNKLWEEIEPSENICYISQEAPLDPAAHCAQSEFASTFLTKKYI